MWRTKSQKAFLKNILTAPPCPNCASTKTMKAGKTLIVKGDILARNYSSRESFFCNHCHHYFVSYLASDEQAYTIGGKLTKNAAGDDRDQDGRITAGISQERKRYEIP